MYTSEKNINNIDFRIGELFSGTGGIAFGAKSAKVFINDQRYSISHVWATDYDKDTCETFRNNICPDNPKSVVCCDIRKLDLKTLRDISEIDALAFGFPCNDFSIIGEQKGMNGVYGPLYYYGIQALEYFKPKFFLAENVGGLRNANDGEAFNRILNDLKKAGYTITPHLYKFEEYGVPQNRHRIIIVGIRNDIDITFYVPSPTQLHPISSKYAMENPPIPENTPNNLRTKQSLQVIKRLEHIKPGENAFTADLPEDLKLNTRGAKISQIYKRLDPDKPAYTITGSGGGGTHVYHWKENRALTNRERARLQTFPDNFIFSGSNESVRKQIGMAFPPLGAKIIFEAILKSFAKIDYLKIENNLNNHKPKRNQYLLMEQPKKEWVVY